MFLERPLCTVVSHKWHSTNPQTEREKQNKKTLERLLCTYSQMAKYLPTDCCCCRIAQLNTLGVTWCVCLYIYIYIDTHTHTTVHWQMHSVRWQDCARVCFFRYTTGAAICRLWRSYVHFRRADSTMQGAYHGWRQFPQHFNKALAFLLVSMCWNTAHAKTACLWRK